MRVDRIVLLVALLTLAGCGAPPPPPPPPVPIDDPPAVAPPKVVPPLPAVEPPKAKDKEPVPPPLAVPVTPADKARLEAAEKGGAGVYESQNGGYEVRIERDSDAGAILAGLKGTKCIVGLNLEGPKVTDAALKHLDGFDYLERLTLHQCPNVTGAEFTALVRLARLKSLAISECPVADAACAAIGRIASLEEIRLSATKVTDAGLKELGGLPALEAIGLAGSQVTGTGFAAPGWAKLRDIEAPNSAFIDPGLEAVAKLPALAVLRLDFCKVTDAGLHHLRNTKTITELWLAGTRITDTGMLSLRELDKLQVLDVSKTVLQGLGFDRVPAGALRKLVLDGSSFDDAGAKHLGRFSGLTTLSAIDCPVSDAGLGGLKDLKKLTKVDLTGTKAGDAAAKLLGTLPELEVATFDRTALTYDGLKALVAAPRLRFVEAREAKVTKQGGVEAAKFGPPGLRISTE